MVRSVWLGRHRATQAGLASPLSRARWNDRFDFLVLSSPSDSLLGDGATPLENAMKSFALKVQRFLVTEDGPTAVEYAVMLALIVIVCLTAIQAIGTNASTTFQNVADQL